ncbi:hypothetical protein [Psychromonas sp. 14N.309.X.WAT.B.A12]|jgi:ABC-type cobalamin/Fe3+-siderophores transport system ATPase subunit|uniref:hypothetical protein n=1 Tax=unclassified Psychromonas TaxID=2614957 RepID=UPI0025AFDA2B|nr:hypothetical protein [Psychromonas sp. 14N.309.X.WAT.B.A12]MDN2662567.1 hypothetical protein [Psychromonas sp. 14N.309.X.WAT.B.A12]
MANNIWSLSGRLCAQHIATVLQDIGAEFALTVFEMVEIDLIPRATGWKRTLSDIDSINSPLY